MHAYEHNYFERSHAHSNLINYQRYTLLYTYFVILQSCNVYAAAGNLEFVVPSASVNRFFSFVFTFSAGESRLRLLYDITDDDVGLEALETYTGDISLSPQAVAAGYTLGTLTQATYKWWMMMVYMHELYSL